MQKRWLIKTPIESTAVEEFRSSLKVDAIVAELLLQREINTFEPAEYFFRPKLEQLHDPFLMKNLPEADELIPGKSADPIPGSSPQDTGGGGGNQKRKMRIGKEDSENEKVDININIKKEEPEKAKVKTINLIRNSDGAVIGAEAHEREA